MVSISTSAKSDAAGGLLVAYLDREHAPCSIFVRKAGRVELTAAIDEVNKTDITTLVATLRAYSSAGRAGDF